MPRTANPLLATLALIIAALAIAPALWAAPAPAGGTDDATFEARRAAFEAEYHALIDNEKEQPADARLEALFDLTYRRQMFESPIWGVMIGYPGAERGRWGDFSLAAEERHERFNRLAGEVLSAIDRSALSEANQLNYDLFRYRVEMGIEGEQFPDEYLVIDQMGGPQTFIADVLPQIPARTLEDYEALLDYLRGVPEILKQTRIRLEAGLEHGITPPRVTLGDVAGQFSAMTAPDPADSVLLKPFESLPDTIPAETAERLRAEAKKIVADQVIPAYRELAQYWNETYLPATRESIAIGALPDGQAWYAHNVKAMTTTDLTPQEIHDIGLKEVARIRAEMEDVIEQSGFEGSFQEFLEFLRTDDRFFFDTPEELLTTYRDIAKRIDPELVKQFGKLPRLPYGVTPVPAFMEQSQTTAYYQPGSLEAGRAGYFTANTYDLESRPSWEMEALTLHEAVPGHHLQIALAQELEDVPEFRKNMSTTAFVEGWALYAESLGEDMGFYQDPYSKFGQLTYEMWRAIRLVVDTGIHSLGWSREQAIELFTQNTGKALHDIEVEVDRYIVWPGQALAYKIGELKIKELRARAEEALGERFDVRRFHDAVLENGAVPLDVLEAHVDEWIAGELAVTAGS